MYTKRIVKPSNSKISSDHPQQIKPKIIVNRTNSNKENKIQKQVINIPPQKNYSLSAETVKKILLAFYPEDKSLFDIILSPINKSTFLYDLDKYYSKLEEFSNTDPFNKYYGVQSSKKIINKKNQSSIDLNKENTDIIFSLVDQLLASFGPKLNLNTIKGNINQIYKCHNLNRINFISNKKKMARVNILLIFMLSVLGLEY